VYVIVCRYLKNEHRNLKQSMRTPKLEYFNKFDIAYFGHQNIETIWTPFKTLRKWCRDPLHGGFNILMVFPIS
jgi:hypothetical protein